MFGYQRCKQTGQTLGELENKLVGHQNQEPEAPRVPKLLLGDETPENLAWRLAKKWPSAGVVSAEAGIVFGAHGMGAESVMRNLALLNIQWDGGSLSIGRRTSESFELKGTRLTVALQVQERTLREFPKTIWRVSARHRDSCPIPCRLASIDAGFATLYRGTYQLARPCRLS